MITIIICFIIATASLWIAIREEFSLVLLMGFMFGVIPGVILSVLGGNYLIDDTNTETFVTHRSEIRSLDDRYELGGSFILGTGTLHEKPVYVFYEEIFGGLQLRQMRADKIIIYEDEQSSPYYVEKEIRVKKTDWQSLFFITRPIERMDREIHIPPKSIKSFINLDLQE